MQPKVMITNGGPHPAEKWAELSVADIIQLGDSDSDQNKAGRKLELKLLDVFEDFYDFVLAEERDQVKQLGDKYLALPINGDEHSTDTLVKNVLAAADGTPFAVHFSEQTERIREVVRHHVAVLQGVESGWHADRSGTPLALAWRENNTNLGIARAHEGLDQLEEVK